MIQLVHRGLDLAERSAGLIRDSNSARQRIAETMERQREAFARQKRPPEASGPTAAVS
ncbi:MAG TPA: hypothetical protein VKU60_21065 [Chloroflexota bacterium]|nr:hypothetical protein [Chloroflexota bacterium]